MRVNVSLDDDFLKIIDDNANRLRLSRSAMISMLCAVALMIPNGITTLNNKKQVYKMLDKIVSGAQDDNE